MTEEGLKYYPLDDGDTVFDYLIKAGVCATIAEEVKKFVNQAMLASEEAAHCDAGWASQES